MIKLLNILKELAGEVREPFKWKILPIGGSTHIFYGFNTPKNEYRVVFSLLGDEEDSHTSYDLSFNTVGGASLDTNENVALQVMSTITEITIDFIKKYEPDEIVMHPIKTKDDLDDRRFKLYGLYLKKNVPQGYTLHALGNMSYRLIKK